MFDDDNKEVKNQNGQAGAPSDGVTASPPANNNKPSKEPFDNHSVASAPEAKVSGQAKNAPAQPSAENIENKRNKVEDILAGTDEFAPKSAKPAAFQPKQPAPESQTSAEKPVSTAASGRKFKKLFALLLIISVLILFGVLGFLGYNKFVNQSETAKPLINEPINNSEPEAKKTGEQKEPAVKQPEAPPAKSLIKEEALDTDKDGLSDEEERALGTNINQVDSDNDGLFDLEEVKVYKTDPLNPDTDGDGFLDGAEVKDGYNPNGAGKLYEIKK